MGEGCSNRQNHPDLAIVDWSTVERIVGPSALLEYKRRRKPRIGSQAITALHGSLHG